VPPTTSASSPAARLPAAARPAHESRRYCCRRAWRWPGSDASFWAKPSVRIWRRRSALSSHNHRAGGGRRPGAVAGKQSSSERTGVGERTHDNAAGAPEFADCRARRPAYKMPDCLCRSLPPLRRRGLAGGLGSLASGHWMSPTQSHTCGWPSGESDRGFRVATATDSGRHRASCAPSARVMSSAQGCEHPRQDVRSCFRS
jgi:hypothetical protein